MYLKHIVMKNIGPISELSVELPFYDNGNPKPLLFVGENGSGKTFLQSQIIDSLYEIGSNLFTDIRKGNNYYKISGGPNLKSGTDQGFSLLKYEDNEHKKIEYIDKVGEITKDEIVAFISDFSLSPNEGRGNQKITTVISNDAEKDKLSKEWISSVHFYQPAYRYEEPFWKNTSFRDEVRFEEVMKFSGKLGKELEVISSNHINKSYLLDLVLDQYVYSDDTDKVLWNSVNGILKAIKKRDDIRFAVGQRGQYRVTIVEKDEKGEAMQDLLPSIDGLSLGESILLNLFINIIRHGDTPPKKHEEIRGVVAIDEIDVHLHSDLQNSILPELIKLFPKVQFIITTHSPLFILGMKREFGEDGFEIRNMPSGEVITTERFSEFDNAYKILRDTEKFDKDIKEKIKESQKPVVFVEGDYDIRYIKKASELFGKQELIEKVIFIDADGYQNLNNIWNHKSNLFKAIPQKMLLLYDCDTKVEEGTKDKVYKRIISYMEENYLDKGIENLFSRSTIDKAIEFKEAFIDYTPEVKKRIRGKEEIVPERYDINPNEKGNLCNWLCKNAIKDDFTNFEKVFGIFEEFLLEEESLG